MMLFFNCGFLSFCCSSITKERRINGHFLLSANSYRTAKHQLISARVMLIYKIIKNVLMLVKLQV